ncbi:MAG TPA: histidine phosphatase family protein [Burkholderiaceae bacterium]|nr:histidine phosphatase family protein [Burkholderiaceae bacterium]
MDDATTEILLIRHGETAWNAEGRIQGQLDVPLSSTGMWQAGRLAERLAADDAPSLAAIIASDLARTWFTAHPVAARLGLQVQPEARLRERAFGVFEGHTLDEVARRWPDEFALWRARDAEHAMPEGESARQVIDRVLAAMHDIVLAYRGATIAVVTHGGVLDVVYRQAQHLAWDAPRQHVMLNAAINRVGAEAPPLRFQIIDWGDIDHLATAGDEQVA